MTVSWVISIVPLRRNVSHIVITDTKSAIVAIAMLAQFAHCMTDLRQVSRAIKPLYVR